MKPLVIVFIFLFTGYGMAQGKKYRDPGIQAALRGERLLLIKIREMFDKEQRVFDDMALHTLKEFLNYSPGINFPDLAETTPIPIGGLCTNFRIMTSPKANKCKAKQTYLMDVAKAAKDIILSETKYGMTAGVKKQILEKYTTIINEINYEIAQMKIENEKRSRLYNSDFFQ